MIKAFQYKPNGVCSKNIIFTADENNIIRDLRVIGGCPGNLLGISALVKGQKIDDVIEKLKGIRCGNKVTSCPDQIAIALEKYKDEQILNVK